MNNVSWPLESIASASPAISSSAIIIQLPAELSWVPFTQFTAKKSLKNYNSILKYIFEEFVGTFKWAI